MDEKQFTIDDFVNDEEINELRYIIYTDGSCIPNPGPGGWAYEIRKADNQTKVSDRSGSDPSTTNNKMELTAVIKALNDDKVEKKSIVNIKSDSQLIINTMTKNWKKKLESQMYQLLENGLPPPPIPIQKKVRKWKNKFIGFLQIQVLSMLNSQKNIQISFG